MFSFLPKILRYIDPGACWTYTGGMKNKTNAWGPLRGLTMVLDVQAHEYLPRHSEQQSFIVSLFYKLVEKY